jgi:hypothetical protein
MTPEEANWFRRCAVEIEEHDGHLIMESFFGFIRHCMVIVTFWE